MVYLGAAAYFATGKIPGPSGWRHRSVAPYQSVQTKNGYIMVGCANQRTWEKLCTDVIDKPEWITDPRFKTNTDRINNVEELEALIEEVMASHDSAYWLDKCEKAGVPSGPINNFAEAMQDPHYLARDMIQEVEHPVIGKMKMIGIPTKFSLTPGKIRMPLQRWANIRTKFYNRSVWKRNKSSRCGKMALFCNDSFYK